LVPLIQGFARLGLALVAPPGTVSRHVRGHPRLAVGERALLLDKGSLRSAQLLRFFQASAKGINNGYLGGLLQNTRSGSQVLLRSSDRLETWLGVHVRVLRVKVGSPSERVAIGDEESSVV